MIQVCIPPTLVQQRTYIVRWILGLFLPPDSFQIIPCGQQDVTLELNGKRLIIVDEFFCRAESNWLKNESLPVNPQFRSIREHFACLGFDRVLDLFPPSGELSVFEESENSHKLSLDVFGTAFFCVTRYEEWCINARSLDKHDRVASDRCVLSKSGSQKVPIVDCQLHILREAMNRIWPEITKLEQSSYRLLLTHDVDWPFAGAGHPLPMLARNVVGDLSKRHSFRQAKRRMTSFCNGLFGKVTGDEYNTFDYIMSTAEQNSIQSEFYFIAGHSRPIIDGVYQLGSKLIESLLRSVHERGHVIGLHPSYDTFQDGVRLKSEFENLLGVCESLGIKQDQWGGRQHFLRWDCRQTWKHWESAGLDYDSSLGYADFVGFRSGTCQSYPVFDLKTNQTLKLIEKPLIVMEGSLLDAAYMGLSHADAYDAARELIHQCRRFQGNFVMLWHNNSLQSEEDRELFEQIVAAAA